MTALPSLHCYINVRWVIQKDPDWAHNLDIAWDIFMKETVHVHVFQSLIHDSYNLQSIPTINNKNRHYNIPHEPGLVKQQKWRRWRRNTSVTVQYNPLSPSRVDVSIVKTYPRTNPASTAMESSSRYQTWDLSQLTSPREKPWNPWEPGLVSTQGGQLTRTP